MLRSESAPCFSALKSISLKSPNISHTSFTLFLKAISSSQTLPHLPTIELPYTPVTDQFGDTPSLDFTIAWITYFEKQSTSTFTPLFHIIATPWVSKLKGVPCKDPHRFRWGCYAASTDWTSTSTPGISRYFRGAVMELISPLLFCFAPMAQSGTRAWITRVIHRGSSMVSNSLPSAGWANGYDVVGLELAL